MPYIMGVKDLLKVQHQGVSIKSLAQSISTLDLVDFTGWIVYVDAHMIIHRALRAYDLSYEGERLSHIDYMISLYNTFGQYDIELVWVFDPEQQIHLKEEELKVRGLRPDRSSITPHEKEIFINMIDLLGMPRIMCQKIEAEHMASLCSRKNPKSMVLSNDTDVLMYGANMLRYIPSTGYELYYIDRILDTYQISYNDFVRICLALGMDYVRGGTKGIGPKRVVDQVKGDKIQYTELQERVYTYITEELEECRRIQKESNVQEAITWLTLRGYSPSNPKIKSLNEQISHSTTTG